MNINLSKTKDISSISAINVDEIQKKIDKFNESAKITTAENNVFSDLKEHLKISGLTMLGGVPASGKTTLAIELSIQAAKNNQPVIFYSFEMSKAQILDRFRKIAKCETLKEFINKSFAKYIYIIELSDFIEVTKEVKEAENSVSLLDFEFFYLKRNIEQLNEMFDEKTLLIVDSLTEIPSSKDNDLMQKVDKAMLNFRYVTDITNVAILVIAHANRAAQSNKVLTMSSFKGSASIEYTTDKIILLNDIEVLESAGVNDNETELYKSERIDFLNEIQEHEKAFILSVAKNRYGKFPMYFKYKYVANDTELNIIQCDYIDISENKDNFLSGENINQKAKF